MIKNLVSFIIRTCNSKNFSLLKIAVESIIENNYRPIEICIIVQSLDLDFFDQVCLEFSSRDVSGIAIKIIHNFTHNDERAKNLNLGIRASTGRYLGFLDDDDILYPNHIFTLVSTLQESETSIWAYTDYASVICDYDQEKDSINIVSKSTSTHTKNNFSLTKLCQNGFIAIHSYLIDRTKIEPDILRFNESLSVLEDYEFMLRLAKHHKPIYIPEITCEYRHYTDFRNSSYSLDQESGKKYRAKAKIWWKSYKKVERIKKEIYSGYHTPFFSYAMRSYILSMFPFLHQARRSWKMLKHKINYH